MCINTKEVFQSLGIYRRFRKYKAAKNQKSKSEFIQHTKTIRKYIKAQHYKEPKHYIFHFITTLVKFYKNGMEIGCKLV